MKQQKLLLILCIALGTSCNMYGMEINNNTKKYNRELPGIPTPVPTPVPVPTPLPVPVPSLKDSGNGEKKDSFFTIYLNSFKLHADDEKDFAGKLGNGIKNLGTNQTKLFRAKTTSNDSAYHEAVKTSFTSEVTVDKTNPGAPVTTIAFDLRPIDNHHRAQITQLTALHAKEKRELKIRAALICLATGGFSAFAMYLYLQPEAKAQTASSVWNWLPGHK